MCVLAAGVGSGVTGQYGASEGSRYNGWHEQWGTELSETQHEEAPQGIRQGQYQAVHNDTPSENSKRHQGREQSRNMPETATHQAALDNMPGQLSIQHQASEETSDRPETTIHQAALDSMPGQDRKQYQGLIQTARRPYGDGESVASARVALQQAKQEFATWLADMHAHPEHGQQQQPLISANPAAKPGSGSEFNSADFGFGREFNKQKQLKHGSMRS